MRILDTWSACTAFQESLLRHGILPGYQLTATKEITAFSGRASKSDPKQTLVFSYAMQMSLSSNSMLLNKRKTS